MQKGAWDFGVAGCLVAVVIRWRILDNCWHLSHSVVWQSKLKLSL